MTEPISLSQREIDAKVDAAVREAIAAGKKPGDMGRRDFASVAKGTWDRLSPAARKQAATDGLKHMAMFVIGNMIAESIWQSGDGWPEGHDAAVAAYRKTTVNGMPLKLAGGDEEALECLAVFRGDLPELNLAEVEDRCEPKVVERFRPLFAGQRRHATLGEIATKKAITGDPLGLSFLSWRPA